ncbi:CNP1-like family protein [Variovorax sp. PCZ-1]|uniref:CNP1-like family protein n=1 Tax=Variovorax sp. PCZ-1 TaxID=2835533 RepID=UPI0020BF3C05|nr:CNP1-like family protein [Variovorax sp. PCZ-1]
MIKRFLAIAALSLASGMVCAQFIADDPDWKESEVPPPPAFDLKRLVRVEMPVQSLLKWGVDPDTVKITKDGIIRYVVVAQSSSGTVNAMYEGIRCNKAEFRRYARHNPGSGWVKSTDQDWTSLRQTGASRHPETLARSGLCDGSATPTSVAEAMKRLNSGVTARQ